MFFVKSSVPVVVLALILSLSLPSDAIPAPTKDLATNSQAIVSRTAKKPVKMNKCPKKAGKKRRSELLLPRTHPSAKEKITLYHGTDPSVVSQLSTLKLSDNAGDFSELGGFYLTDKLEAAGQYYCHGKEVNPKPTNVAIVEYTWNGPAHATKVLEWSSDTETKQGHPFMDFCGINNNDDFYRSASATTSVLQKWRDTLVKDIAMVSGPMNLEEDACLTKGFWQYAVIEEEALKSLTQVKVHNEPCSKFPAAQ